MKKRKVMAFGTFDLLHKGHLYYLKNASRYGELYAVVSRDKTVRKVKGKKPVNNEKIRLRNVAQLPFITHAELGSLNDRYKIVEKIKPQIICLGYDQNISITKLRTALGKRGIKAIIRRIRAYKPEIYKTSRLLSKIKKLESEKLL